MSFVGVARLFNIRLPMNFNSPFKAASIVELWKRWHMTMTRFFQTYVHMPLSITLLRIQMKYKIRGNLAIHISTFVTLLAIGLWHGANWTYVIFGAMQGCAILLNHLWRAWRIRRGTGSCPAPAGVFLTYIFFALSCVIYRAENLDVAWNMYRSMFLPGAWLAHDFKPEKIALWLGGALICFCLPNTQQIMQRYMPVLDHHNIQKIMRETLFFRAVWRPTAAWCAALLALYVLSLDILLDANRVQEFIYFQF